MTDEEINEQELDRFEARFFGTLPETEAAAFDAALDGDAERKERYELFVLSVRGIRSGDKGLTQGEEQTLRDRFKAIDRELDARPTVVRSIVQPWMGWAAAALVLVGVSGMWWLRQGDTPQELAAEFALSEPGLPVLMGTSPKAMDAIMNAYKHDDFATAQLLITSALKQDPQNDTLHYFNGVLDTRTTGCAAAEASFVRVPSTSVFAAKAQYNLALCAMQAGAIPRVRELLSGITNVEDAQVAAKARDLLKRLESM